MSNEMHPSAANAIDADGERLVSLLKIQPLGFDKKGAFESRKPTSGTISDQDMVDEPTFSDSNAFGDTLAKFFIDNQSRVTLAGDDYTQLRLFVDKALRIKPLSKGLSSRFLETETFKWIRDRHRNAATHGLSQFLRRRYDEEVRPHQVLVPITAIEFERPFRFGDVRVRTIDAVMFDRALQSMLQDAPEEHQVHLRNFVERQRKYHLGWTAVELTLHGEAGYVYDQAFAIANDMAAVFRFMSPAGPTARLPFPCFALDKPVCPTRTAYLPQSNGSFGMNSGIIHHAMHNYRMSFTELNELMTAGLANLVMFFDGRKLNDHQQRVRSSLLAYSRGLGSFDQEDRLIYAMTAAEHLLLANSDEPIQSNVSDRMAFIVAQNATDRRRAAKNFKDAYSQRSRYVHHHLSVSDQDVLEDFFRNMYVMLFTVISNMHKIKTQSEFLNMLEEAKFS